MTKNWRAVLIDDERLARQKLRRLLDAHENIDIVAEADGVETGKGVIEKENPDVIFLDIQMPNATGFDLLKETKTTARTIFVTAFDEFAIRAFEVNALDYLLKPISPGRLREAIERLSISGENTAPTREFKYEDYFFVNQRNSSEFVKVSSIKFISAADVYSEVNCTNGQSFLISKPLNDWELQLPQESFVRIHRSTIINLEHVGKIEKWFNDSHRVYLKGVDDPLTISRRYFAKIKGRFS